MAPARTVRRCESTLGTWYLGRFLGTLASLYGFIVPTSKLYCPFPHTALSERGLLTSPYTVTMASIASHRVATPLLSPGQLITLDELGKVHRRPIPSSQSSPQSSRHHSTGAVNDPDELRLVLIRPPVFKVIYVGSALHATTMRETTINPRTQLTRLSLSTSQVT